MRRVAPEVYCVARTKVDLNEVDRYLEGHYQTHWEPTVPPQESLIEFMGRLCYRAFAVGLNANVTKIREKDYIQNIVNQKHGSVLEHVSVSFVFANVSRVFTHELVRHRIASYSQESLRYVRLTELGLWLPDGTPSHIVALFEKAFTDAEQLQAELAKALDVDSLPFEEKKRLTSLMRRAAPDGLSTVIGMTANLRSWRHLIELRTTTAAEVEIRVVMREVGRMLKESYPNVFDDFTLNEAGEWTTPNSKI